MNGEFGGNPQVGKNIGVYVAFGIGSAGLVFVQSVILWISCSIEVRIQYFGTLRRGMARNRGAILTTLPNYRLLVNSMKEWL